MRCGRLGRISRLLQRLVVANAGRCVPIFLRQAVLWFTSEGRYDQVPCEEIDYHVKGQSSPDVVAGPASFSFIRVGTLSLIDGNRRRRAFGCRTPTPAVTVRLHDSRLHTKLALNPELYAVESYMDGTLIFEEGGSIYDLPLLFSVNRDSLGAAPSQQLLRRFWHMTKRLKQANTPSAAARNARSHYGVPVEIYRLFLDEGLNYSCAFFHNPDTDTLGRPSLPSLPARHRSLA